MSICVNIYEKFIRNGYTKYVYIYIYIHMCLYDIWLPSGISSKKISNSVHQSSEEWPKCYV